MKDNDNALATNRRAYHNYDILDTYEAGIALWGSEVKSVRDHRITIGEAYVKFESGEIWLIGANIARYDSASYMSHNPDRRRKLLLHKKEMRVLAEKTQEKGLTMVPLKVYLKGNLVKILVGLGKGKKEYDKREAIQKRETDRIIERTLKNR
jgi:SsrA-binding protein